MIKKPIVTALNTSTYTAIVVPIETNKLPRAMTYFTEDGSSFKQAIDDSGNGEAILPANVIWSEAYIGSEDGIIFYAKATTGTPNLVVKIGEVRD